MNHEIKVRVVEFTDRQHYQMQYRDPVTRRKVTRSTGIERTGRKKERTEAEKEAGKWQSELREGRYQSPSKTTWKEFRDRYEVEGLSGKAAATEVKVQTVFALLERICNPASLRSVDGDMISRFQAELRKEGRSECTIAGYLAHLRAALQWGKATKLLREVPDITRQKRAKKAKLMKGRPITREEFERMLAKVEAGLTAKTGKKDARPRRSNRRFSEKALVALKDARTKALAAAVPGWRHYLEGLWCSGLRLEESLNLWWDRDDRLCPDFTGKRPMLRIPAECEKGNQDRLLPLSPEFARFLSTTPPAERKGRVFKLVALRGGVAPTKDHVSRIVSAIGEAAGVKVNTDARTAKVKFASAHDLRRSFGARWATKVMPQVLMELMRHESMETTLRYYVGRNAQATADVLWKVDGQSNNLGNMTPSEASDAVTAGDSTPDVVQGF